MYISEQLEKQLQSKRPVTPIPFNKPYFTGRESVYLSKVMQSGKISGSGVFTKDCEAYFKSKYGFDNNLLVTSCTHALEMAALLLDIKEGDEVIMPSFTFVSTANAFMLRGAKIVFADSRADHPGIDEDSIESLITSKTKAIVVVHYAGVACDMDKVNAIASKYDLHVVEDAAQGIDGYYKGDPLGSLGDLGAISFHETKNITCGEGGLLNIANKKFYNRAEIIREKGTNRSNFLRGEVSKYTWVDIGSSYVLSEMNAAFLLAQLEHLEEMQQIRRELWNEYYNGLKELEEDGLIKLPVIPEYASNNAHIFYIVLPDLEKRNELMKHLQSEEISAVFHYPSLHSSDFFKPLHDGRDLPNSNRYSDGLLRLPLFCDLSLKSVQTVVGAVKSFVKDKVKVFTLLGYHVITKLIEYSGSYDTIDAICVA